MLSVNKLRPRAPREYQEHCGTWEFRQACRWCDVYGYLEHRRHGAPVQYLCRVAQATRVFKENWLRHHRRSYEIAGLTVQVEADLPITEDTFAPKFKEFEVSRPGNDVIAIRHHFSLPDLKGRGLGREVYRQPPWAIYRQGRSWIYRGISPDGAVAPPIRWSSLATTIPGARSITRTRIPSGKAALIP